MDKIEKKQIFLIAIPLVMQQLFYQIVIYVDRAILGHINSEYFSAIGNATAPFYTVTAIIGAVCGATTIFISQTLGAKKNNDAKKYAEASFIGNSILPLLFFLLFFFFSRYIFKIMGVKSPILEYSESYMKIISLSLLFFGFETSAQSIMQGLGVTKIIMISGIIKNILNIIFDCIFIFGLFGLPKMGINGAAYGTLFASICAAPIIIIYVMHSSKIPFKIELKNVLRFKWNDYKGMIKVGLPSGIESSLWNIGNLIVMSFLNKIDIMAAGVYALIFSFEILPNIIYMGFARAGLTLVGHKTGEKDYINAKQVGFKCMRISLTICTVISLSFIIFGNSLLKIFTDDNDMVVTCLKYIPIICITMFPRSINNVIGLGIQGMGDTKWMLYGQIIGTIFVVVVSYLLIFTFNFGLMGLFITFLLDETLRSIINLLRFWKGREFFHLKEYVSEI